MTFEIQIRRAAEVDVAEAQLWYDTQERGLGSDFYKEFSRVVNRISENPYIYAAVYRDVRMGLLRRFPFIVWYQIRDNVVIVVACTHCRQDRRGLEGRR